MLQIKNLYYKLRIFIYTYINPSITTVREFIYSKIYGKTLAEYLRGFSEETRLKKYRQLSIKKVADLLKKFEARERLKIRPRDFNQRNASNFLFYLQTVGYRPNSVFYFGSIIKTYIRILDDEGVKVNKAFLRMKLVREEYAGVVLTKPEVSKIYYHQTPHEIVKIYFIIGCCTGLRESDFFRITKEHIRNGVIVIKNLKNGKISRIPVHWMVREIFIKYHYKLPSPCSATNFNAMIKKICKEAGLTELVTIECLCKGELIPITKPKYKFIASHTARRTFISTLSDDGITFTDSMILTSHSSMNVHMGYMAGKSLNKANELKNHPYFTGENTQGQ